MIWYLLGMNRRMSLVGLVFGLVAVSSAQISTEPQAEIKAIDWMNGTWEGTIMMNVQGVEIEQKGTMTISTDLQFKKIVGKSQTMGMDFNEVSYISFNAETKKYSMHTFANWAPTPRVESGTWDGTKWVMVSDPWSVPGMGTITSRTTITKASDTEMQFLLELRQGEDWVKTGEGTYTKKES